MKVAHEMDTVGDAINLILTSIAPENHGTIKVINEPRFQGDKVEWITLSYENGKITNPNENWVNLYSDLKMINFIDSTNNDSRYFTLTYLK